MIASTRASLPTCARVRADPPRADRTDFRSKRMNPTLFRIAPASLAFAAMFWAATPQTPAQEKKGGPVYFEIKPAPLKADREERALPGPVTDACVGGGGRFIVLNIPSERKVAVFDVK